MKNTKFDYILNIQLFAEDDDQDKKEDEKEKVYLDEDDFEDNSNGDDQKNKTEKKPQQDKETNAQQAEARRKREKEEKERREREEKIKEESYLKGKLDSTKVNEFTDEPIEDEYDLKVYEMQKKIKAQGGDPVTDLPKYLAKQEREVQKAQKEKESAVEKDISAYRKSHPNASNEDIEKIISHPLGAKFLGKLSLEEIDDLISQLSTNNEKKETTKVKMPGSTAGAKKTETSYSQKSKEDRIKELRKAGLIR